MTEIISLEERLHMRRLISRSRRVRNHEELLHATYRLIADAVSTARKLGASNDDIALQLRFVLALLQGGAVS